MFVLFTVGGGCSIPNAVRTECNGKGLVIDGILLNLDGSRFVKDHIEISDLTVPMATSKHSPTFFASHSHYDALLFDDHIQSMDRFFNQMNLKENNPKSHMNSVVVPALSTPCPPSTTQLSLPSQTTASTSALTTTTATEVTPLLRHYAHVCCVNINETILENAELCGTNLAVKLMQMGADSILEEIRPNADALAVI